MKYFYMAMLLAFVGVGAGCNKSDEPAEFYSGFTSGVPCAQQYKELANQTRCEQDQHAQN